ncbi:BREX system ATP-binding domain-containing protein [Mycolicibacterium sp. GCM10028919]|uniref:BREX system ATP-binding domain-containing protein n=1 Tax=Mycolicibacterium sp. GCM10028919 TaxID=3273401 RepID=UPI003623AFD2
MIESAVHDRRAIEALRAGVPNGDAVRALGSGQSEIIAEFEARLGNAAEMQPQEPTGFVMTGSFGSGKSHLVEELHQLALSRNYVSSKIAVSKETPLHSPQKVVQAAVGAMQAMNKPDGVLIDMVMRHNSDKQTAQAFHRWCGSRESGVSFMFRSLLELRDAAAEDLEVVDLLVQYFSGGTVPITTIRRHFNEVGLRSPMEVVPAIDRPWQTMRFLSRFCQVFGYRGWVIFLDEAELISKYGPISRARAYDQLGRWLGLLPGHRIAGTAVVATVINDFAWEVLGQKGDRWAVPELLGRGRKPADLDGVKYAVQAMQAIDEALPLIPMTLAHLENAQKVLREAHSRAYEWDAPVLDVEYRRHDPMRHYVRRWINEWDVRRLYGRKTKVKFEVEDIDFSYEQDDGFDGPEWTESVD